MVKFSEVKSTNDRLSETQKAWLTFFIENGIMCEVCLVNWEINSSDTDHIQQDVFE